MFELNPFTEVPGCAMGKYTVFGVAFKFILHVPVQWGMERGQTGRTWGKPGWLLPWGSS